jgi:hypothetical protein
MLSIEKFIEKVHINPKSYFLYTLENMIDEQISYVYNKLENKDLWETNPTLFTELKETLHKINKKSNWFTNFFSMFIPMEDHKFAQKKQLLALLDTINMDINSIQISIHENHKAIESISKMLNYLKKLKDNFILDDNEFFIKEIDDKIILLKGYNLTLSFKEVNLLELKKVYQTYKTKG